jgi:hypothetical protein
MIGRIEYTNNGGSQWMELSDDGKLTGSDPYAVLHFRDVFANTSWTPADGFYGYRFMMEANQELGGKLTLKPIPDVKSDLGTVY